MTQIVAIDATRFGKPEEQFKPQMLLRELNKAYVGFFRRPSEDFLGPLTAIATGNWGCGAFGGDKRLKFLLQLMACSEAKRDMVYYTFGESRLQQELFAMYNHLVGMDITVGRWFKKQCSCKMSVGPSNWCGAERLLTNFAQKALDSGV